MTGVPVPPPARLPPALERQILDDPWTRSLGIEYLELRRGYCRLTVSLAPRMLNFQGRPHGGVVFTLADAAFGAACNSHGEPSVALSVTISYLAPAPPGARLVAECTQVRQGRRAGFYDVIVTREDGTVVAQAHGIAHRLGTARDVSRRAPRETRVGGAPASSARASRSPGGARRRARRRT